MKRVPLHPGEILREEYVKPLKLEPRELARELGIPTIQLNQILDEKRGLTEELATGLAIRFKTTVMFWLALQRSYEEDSK